MNQVLNIFDRLKKRASPIPLFFTIFILKSIFYVITSFFAELYDPEITNTNIFEGLNLSSVEIFILTVIVGPLIETIIFQYLIIEFLLRFKKIKTNIIILVSALAFGCWHYYNLIYVLVTCVGGFIYASYYLYLKTKETESPLPLLYIFSLHALWNFLSFILNDTLNL